MAFNLGLVYAALHRPVDAVRALQQALAHPEALKPEDLDDAQRALREQSDDIATVAVTANVREGVVEVDNVEAAQLPLAQPLSVSSGAHVIGVVSPWLCAGAARGDRGRQAERLRHTRARRD